MDDLTELKGKPTCLYVDDKTINLLDQYKKIYNLSRSAALRIIVHDFFLKQGGKP